ncbi:MAG: 50S ribosomal protein L18 [Spirochaetia bacterium]|nr:50S ribosomal protein L18 [Spirochaetia bacterium]
MSIHGQHSSKKIRARRKLKIKNRNNHKRIYFHVSNKHLNAQLINDSTGATLVMVSTVGKKENAGKNSSNITQAKNLADAFVQKMSEKKFPLSEVYVFDRGGRIYHGKVAAFAAELREKGVKI